MIIEPKKGLVGGVTHCENDSPDLPVSKNPGADVRSEATILAILEKIANKSGEIFLQALLREICHALNVRYALVSQLIGADQERALVLNMWPPALSADPIEYKLHGTPCSNVVNNKLCRYGSNVQSLFPEDQMLVDMSAQSYMGAPLFASNGEANGLLVLLDDKPMPADPYKEDLIRFFALRSGAEIERMKYEERLLLDHQILENISEGVLISDADNKIVSVNRAFTRITGYRREEVLGREPGILRSNWQDDGFYQNMWASLEVDSLWRGEIWNRRKDGDVYPEWLTINRISDENGVTIRYIAVFSDITLRKESEARMAYLAHHDPLTGLANRILLEERLVQSLSLAQRQKQLVALMFIDLDRFKVINDTLGHDVGDQLLMLMATRLKESVRDGDTVARLGGDEFILLLHNIDGEGAAAQIAEKIINLISKPFSLADNEIFITVSIGVSLYPDNGNDRESLLKFADIAMYRAKSQGGNGCQFYRPELNARTLERLTMESRLQRAIERDELILHYQPTIDIKTGQLLCAEALVRWESPDYGLVSPALFIPLAEESGAIVQIGEWVLNRACLQIAEWRSQGVRTVPISVNMSARQFMQRGLDKIVEQALNASGVEGEALYLELTEQMIMDDVEAAIEAMHLIKALGVKLAIDDFGTGYSSLSYLKRFPLDILKIDQTFVRDIVSDHSDRAIVSIIINMARALDMVVVAEGVETQGQLKILSEEGCDSYQGYYFSRPVLAADFVQLLLKTNPQEPA